MISICFVLFVLESNLFAILCDQLATEIAELHGLNPREVQISILFKWLAVRVDVGGGDADETFYEDLNVTVAAEEASTTDEDVIK